MDSLSYKTTQPNKATVKKEWLIVDAENQTLGRFTSRVAALLRGKHKTSFTPHVDCGDHVIVINAEKIKFTGKKMTDKQYIRYTGYPGGQRFSSPESVLAKNPVKVIEMAVKGMLPKTRLGRDMFRNLHVTAGNTHKFESNGPKAVNLNEIF